MFRRLAAASDVVIENFGAGVMAKWGCGYDDLVADNPQFTMVSLSGYGRTGPRAGYLAYGSNIANFTGIGDVWWTNPTYGDFLTAAHAAVAVLAARRHVVATGEGVLSTNRRWKWWPRWRRRSTSTCSSTASGATTEVDKEGALLRHVFSCTGDDRWAVVEATRLDEWNAVCDVVERPELRATRSTTPSRAATELRDAVDEWASVRTPLSAAHLLSLAECPRLPSRTPRRVITTRSCTIVTFRCPSTIPISVLEQPRDAVPHVGDAGRQRTGRSPGRASTPATCSDAGPTS